MLKHLTLAAITLVGLLYQIEVSANEIDSKFLSESIVPDVLTEVKDLKSLEITYPSGAEVKLGNVLTPTQVKDVPKVKWEAEEGAYYTLLLTGE